jgi:hypothetical protein
VEEYSFIFCFSIADVDSSGIDQFGIQCLSCWKCVCVCFDHFVIGIESACGQGIAFVLSYLDRVGGALILLS